MRWIFSQLDDSQEADPDAPDAPRSWTARIVAFPVNQNAFRAKGPEFCEQFVELALNIARPRWFIVCLYSLGDTYLLCALAKRFKEVHCRNGEQLFFLMKEAHLPIAEMFRSAIDGVYVLSSQTMQDLMPHLFQNEIKGPFRTNTAQFLHPHHVNDTRIDDFTNIEGVSQAQMYCHLMRLPISSRPAVADIPESRFEEGEAFCRRQGIPKGKSVVLFPESNSWPQEDDGFWHLLSAALSEHGWRVYTNAAGNARGARKTPLRGSHLLEFPLEIAMPVLCHAGWAVGSLCGFMNVAISSRSDFKKTVVVKGPKEGRTLRFNEYIEVQSAFPYAYQRKFDGFDYDIEEYQVRGPSSYPVIADKIATGFNAQFDSRPLRAPTARARVDSTPGDLIDRITVLEVKVRKLGQVQACRARKELEILQELWSELVAAPSPAILELIEESRILNERGWDVNEHIYSDYDDGHYGTADWVLDPRDPAVVTRVTNSVRRFRESQAINRARIGVKNRINELLGAGWGEEKSFLRQSARTVTTGGKGEAGA